MIIFDRWGFGASGSMLIVGALLVVWRVLGPAEIQKEKRESESEGVVFFATREKN
jgi:hypothetical protein